jgi:hypothetical protein
MITQATSSTSAPSPRTGSLAALTRYEVRRYIRNPFFLAGGALTALTSYLYLRHTLTDPGGLPGYPALFLGVFGMIIGFRLTQSLTNAADALDVAPTPRQIRTAAMCLTALLPFALGLLTLLALLTFQHVAGPWTYGTFSASDRFALLAGEIAIASLGGPLLGIAVARWVHSFWVLPVLVTAVGVWVVVVNGLASTYPNSLAVVMLRLLSPYTYFLVLDTHPQAVETWRGSPWFFMGWQLCLCGVAAIAALLRDATPPARRRLLRMLFVVVSAAVAMYLLATLGGLSHAVISHPDGTVRPL